jgi:Leucine Rich repeat
MTDKVNHNNRVRSSRPSWIQENNNDDDNKNHQNLQDNKKSNQNSSSAPPHRYPPRPPVSVLEFGVSDSIATMVTLLHEAALPDFSDVQVVTFRDIVTLHPSVVAAVVQLFRCVPRRQFLQVHLINCCWWCYHDVFESSGSHKYNNNNNDQMEYDETENQFLVSLLANAVLWAENVRGLTLETPFMTEEMIVTVATALQCNCPTLELNLNVNFCCEEENDDNDDDNHDSAAAADEDPVAATTTTRTRSPTSTTVMVAQVLGQSLRHNTLLQTLDLTGCHWDHTSVQQFANGLCGNVQLQSLTLSKGQLPDHDLAFFLTKVFQSPRSTSSTSSTPTTTRTSSPFQLRELNVSGNGARSQTIQVLSQLLQSGESFPFLAQLDLSDQSFLLHVPAKGGGEEPTLNVTPLFEAMYHNVTLTHLNVSGNAPFRIDTTDYENDGIDNKDGIHPHCPFPMMELAKVLQHNTTLTHLVLSGNCISDLELKEMARGWKTNKTLELVDLQHNEITDQGILEDIVPIVRAAAAAAAAATAATRTHHKSAGGGGGSSSSGGGLHTLYLAGNAFLVTGAQAILASTLGGRIQTDIVNVWSEKQL